MIYFFILRITMMFLFSFIYGYYYSNFYIGKEIYVWTNKQIILLSTIA